MSAHIVTSHGADFFGEDRHAAKTLGSLAGYAEGVVPVAERGPLLQLLGAIQAGEERTVPAAEAGALGELFRRVARHRFVKSKAVALAAAVLADAAARAAADGEPWQWRTEAA